MAITEQKPPLLETSWVKILLLLALAAISVAVIFANAPYFQPVPNRDSGGFYYIGQQMLRGQKLYTDLFDVKPPFIFFVNALGLWLGNGSVWGVWALEAVSLLATALLGFSLLYSASGVLPAFLAMLAFLGNLLHILLGGNFTEEYSLPFEFLILVCVLPAALGKPLKWRAFFAGVAWGTVFFFKQNFWGIGLAVGLFLFFRGVLQWKKGRFWEVVWYGGGFLAVCALVAAYFLANGTLSSLWDAAFMSNFYYITTPFAVSQYSRLDLFLRTFNEVGIRGEWIFSMLFVLLAFLQWTLLAAGAYIRDSCRWPAWLTPFRRFVICLVSGILLIGMLVSVDFVKHRTVDSIGLLQWTAIVLLCEWMLFGLLQWQGRLAGWIRSRLEAAFSPRLAILTAIAGLAFLLDLVSISLSGKFFTHYFLMLFPSAAVLTAALAAVILSIRRPAWLKMGAALVLAAAFVPVGLLPLANTVNAYRVNGDPEREAVVAYIDAHTQPGDQVLMWGSEPVINFLAGRTRPNRFVFMSQLFLQGYASSALADEMLHDLQVWPPALIIDANNCGIPFIEYLADCGVPPAYWNGVFDFVLQHYQRIGGVGPDKWQVYQLK